jgi:hypothetical protein
MLKGGVENVVVRVVSVGEWRWRVRERIGIDVAS